MVGPLRSCRQVSRLYLPRLPADLSRRRLPWEVLTVLRVTLAGLHAAEGGGDLGLEGGGTDLMAWVGSEARRCRRGM